MVQEQYNFKIESLGEGTIPSPVVVSYYTSEKKHILFNNCLENFADLTTEDGVPLSVEVAGPRDKIFFDPAQTKAAIATCGGLCPGINDVIRSIVMTLYYRYGVKNIIG
ncbi:MAG: ATP-dependent 6-phosphofructokinase, partial [Deltaproteobacteria bacterium]|nr:ATP-dependent 6-phosphofructokinase [Deltaproteobacteria bacterium]